MKSAALAVALVAGSVAFGTEASAQSAELLRQREQSLVETLRNEWAARKAAGATPATLVEPSVVAGAVLTPSVNVAVAPGVPALQLTLKSGTVGVSSLIATLTSPDGRHNISTSFVNPPAYPPEPAKQTLKFTVASPFSDYGFGFYTEPGAWMLTNVTLFTKDGQVIDYGSNQLAVLFSSTIVNVVNNGTPDTTPPSATKGMILTPTVSLGSASPTFAARLNAKDDISGVASIGIGIAGPAGSNFNTSAYVEVIYPATKGSFVSSTQLVQGNPVGTYTITSIGICDVAQNCVYDDSAADIMNLLGTTTFNVTK